MIVEMEAASFISSLLKMRISPNRALRTHVLLVLLLVLLLFFFFLAVGIATTHISCLSCAFLAHYTAENDAKSPDWR